MSIDLEGVRTFVEDQLMDDEGIVVRDRKGKQDIEENWDPDEGTYVGESSGPDSVYDGKCYISMSGNQPDDTNESGFGANEEWYFLNIPLSAVRLLDGDLFQCTSSLRNPHLVGKIFQIQSDQLGTFKVKQKYRMRRVVRRALR